MNKAQLVELARNTALARGKEHSYVVPGFEPHEWVIDAMWAAYCAGFADADVPSLAESDMAEG